ncbi:carbohydrate-binding module family 6 protein, partial [Aureobasidium melanogenum]
MYSFCSRLLLVLGAVLGTLRSVQADNPIIQTIYTADPAPVIVGDRVYLLADHDENGSTNYNMKDWRLFSTADMANWQDHGVIASIATTFPWADLNAWAGQIIARDNKFYMYLPMRRRGGNMAIGVAVANSITGPWKDAIGKPLLENGRIDPTVWIDDNGQAYLYFANPGLFYVKLNPDMISYSGSIVQVPTSVASFGSGREPDGTTFAEGPWIYKRNDMYYLVYAANCCSEDIRYSTGPSITGPWTYRGVVMASAGKSFTNHPAVIDFKGKSYFFYHNGALPGGSGYTRSIAVEPFAYNSDGTIPLLTMNNAGAPQVGTLNPYTRNEAETMAFSSGIQTQAMTEGGIAIVNVENGDYVKVAGVAFGNEAKSFSARIASATDGGKIELRLGSVAGTLVGTCNVPGTNGWQAWQMVSCAVSGATGTKDLYLKFTGGSGHLFNVDCWQFS